MVEWQLMAIEIKNKNKLRFSLHYTPVKLTINRSLITNKSMARKDTTNTIYKHQMQNKICPLTIPLFNGANSNITDYKRRKRIWNENKFKFNGYWTQL
jgi:hypothetical protein